MAWNNSYYPSGVRGGNGAGYSESITEDFVKVLLDDPIATE
jgi:hypothetical protein